MLRNAVPLTAALALLASVARTHDEREHEPAAGTSVGVTNSLCPVTTDEPVDPTIVAAYEGQRVYFCCARCRMKFLENPEEYVANVPQLTASASLEGGDEGHARGNDHPSLQTPARLIRFAGRFHPLAVHFPIAVLISALVVQLMATMWHGPRFIEASRVLVLIGAPMAVLAAGLGWAAGALLTLFASERHWRRPAPSRRVLFLATLGGTALLVGLTGHFGGTLIHGTEHFSW